MRSLLSFKLSYDLVVVAVKISMYGLPLVMRNRNAQAGTMKRDVWQDSSGDKLRHISTENDTTATLNLSYNQRQVSLIF